MGGLGVVTWFAEEAGVIGPTVAEGRLCLLGQNAKGMIMRVQPLHDWDYVLQGVQEQDHEEWLLVMGSRDRIWEHAAWNAAGFRCRIMTSKVVHWGGGCPFPVAWVGGEA